MSDDPPKGKAVAYHRPARYAAMVAIGYVLAATFYIYYSDYLAAQAAPGLMQLAVIQRIKGLAYVAATGALLFLFAWHLYRRIYTAAGALMETQQALLDSERRATAGVLCLSVAHDSNNLLQVLVSNAYLLERQAHRLDPEGRMLVDGLRSALDSLQAILEQMRTGGRRAVLDKPADVDLPQFLRESLTLLSHHDRLKRCTVTLEATEAVPMTIHPALVHDALVNLLLNAGDALGGAGRVAVHCRPAEGGALIEVHDDGPGVPESMRPLLFQAFNTTKADGTGLGLLAVKTCAELHGGRVDYLPSPLGGACFRFLLRSVAPPAAA